MRLGTIGYFLMLWTHAETIHQFFVYFILIVKIFYIIMALQDKTIMTLVGK